MDQELKEQLEKINNNILSILLENREIKEFRKTQETLNSRLIKEIESIDLRVNKTELDIQKIKNDYEYNRVITNEIKSDLKEILKSQNQITNINTAQEKELISQNNQINNHRKIFFTMLSLNFSLFIALVSFLLNKYL